MGERTYLGAISAAALISAVAFAAPTQTLGDPSDSHEHIVQLSSGQSAPKKAQERTEQEKVSPNNSNIVGGYLYDWTALQAAIDADVEVPDGYFIVGNATDEGYLFAYEKGSFSIDRKTHLASASKWLLAALAMRMAQNGIIDLDDPMQPALAFWTNMGTKKDVKLHHGLSMTSGFNGSPLVGGCQLSPTMTLYNCAKNIHDFRYDILRPGNAPGAQYGYGPHGMQVAAAYLEAADTSIEPGTSPARQRNFHELFIQHVAGPLSMADTSWHSPATTPPTNPWVAGGAYSTARDYAKILRAFLGGDFITDMAGFTQQRTAGLPRAFVPAISAGWEYALGSFVECDTVTTCASSQINSSPGALGWVGWIDRKTGYYGLIATEISSAGDRKSVELEQQMQALIEATIMNRVALP